MRFRERGSYLIFPFEMFPSVIQSASWFEDQNYPDPSLHHNNGDVSDRPGFGGTTGTGSTIRDKELFSRPQASIYTL